MVVLMVVVLPLSTLSMTVTDTILSIDSECERH